jgi:DNA-binding NtrC family response regulator
MAIKTRRDKPLDVVVTGEAESWLPALETVVGPRFINAYKAETETELLDAVERGPADAAVLDEGAHSEVPVLQMLRLIRRVKPAMPVIVVTTHTDRRWLENALRLAAFSVVTKPMGFELLLRQLQRVMNRLDRTLREGSPLENQN